MRYQLISDSTTVRGIREDGIELFIPDAPGNADWERYQQWLAAGNQPEPAPELPSAPLPIISDRQFFQMLAAQGLITQDEALAAVRTGTVPAEMQHFLDAITDPQERFAADMVLSGATQFERRHPLVEKFGYALGFNDDQIDDLWRYASTL